MIENKIPQDHPPVGELDEDECSICIVRRHPFGIIVQVFSFILAAVTAVGIIIYGIPEEMAQKGTPAYSLVIISLIFLVAIMSLLAFAFVILYYESRLVVTNKNVTQIIQRGIFNRQTSQLSFANVEDVSAWQKGVFSTFFNFGTLTIETAGEQNNFVFKYCPDVSAVAKAILEARESFLEGKQLSRESAR